MATLLLIIHVAIAIALIITVLLQRSEGGALGIGGGGSTMSGRSSANLLTRTTAILAAGFFLTSIALTVLARTSTNTESKIDSIKVEKTIEAAPPIVPEKPAPKKTEGPVIPSPK